MISFCRLVPYLSEIERLFAKSLVLGRNITDRNALIHFHQTADNFIQCSVAPAADNEIRSAAKLLCLFFETISDCLRRVDNDFIRLYKNIDISTSHLIVLRKRLK